MRKKYTLIVLSNSGSPLKQMHLSAFFLTVILLLTFIGAGCLAYTAYDFFSLKSRLVAQDAMNHTLKLKEEELVNQRRQIQKFAGDINSIKNRLVELNNFKKQIRIIADIDASDNEEPFFGMGGSIPEDLDTGTDLKKKNDKLVREIHEQVKQLDVATVHQAGEFEQLLEKLKRQRNLLARTPTIRPAEGWITSRFGYRKSPFTSRREMHKGLDISNRIGTPILAAADGVVSYVGKKGLYGNIVIIDHGHGLQTRYAHLSKTLKDKNERVKRGDVIAQMGNTGRSTGPHLHYEVRLNGVPVNPSKYILN
jgi:murein DD-endopeptidase MepM/ murein hydrolase activator NlpD